jgi:hypothetical protein
MGIMKRKNSGMRLQDNEKGCKVKKNYSLMLYQRVAGDFYTINFEGKFTLSIFQNILVVSKGI